MRTFATKIFPIDPDATAPDGSSVRVLLGLHGGGMAHFELGAGQVSKAVTHRSVEEIWFVVGGRGEMWRRQGDQEETVVLEPGVTLTIPLGTHFQFRAVPTESLAVVAITMPPWPDESEAMFVQGPWVASDGGSTFQNTSRNEAAYCL